ncbi:class I SAM-dependent methyltransferase [Poriferisphaera sp. WC338]|uniref:class I SAM-dependent methyltransferase n=1 Tax=Poriferisphaera sp. WC338 TaxID=3425129 RepID=UPI003D81AC9C
MVAEGDKEKVSLGTIQETMIVPLWARAIEQQQEEPILRDRMSAAIMERLDYHIEPKGVMPYLQVRLSVRGRLLDDFVLEFLGEHPRGCVIEIGCGLSTRFHRIDNGEVNWVCVDLPDLMQLREKLIDPHERLTNIKDSIFEHGWIDQVKKIGGPYMIVIEGLLPYFDKNQVTRIFKTVSDEFDGSRIAFDTQTELYRKLVKPGKLITAEDGESGLSFKWTVKQIEEIEQMEGRLHLRDTRTLPELPKKQYHRLTFKTRLLETASCLFWGRYRVNVFDILGFKSP